MGRGNGVLQQTLRRRLESCKARYSSAEDIVNHLRSTYPEYHRAKSQTLLRLVHDALHSTNDASRKRQKTEEEEDEEDEDEDEDEEDLHIRTRPSTSSDCVSERSGCGDRVVSEETDFDLTKTMLRNSYYSKANEEEKNVEVEEIGNEAKSSSSPKRVMFRDFGGMNEILKDLRKDLRLPCNPELHRHIGTSPITGILLHGLPGCGKTRFAQAIANETGFNYYSIASTELVSGVSGGSEKKIRELFALAKRTAPSVIFIDEIDAIASTRGNLQRGMEKRMVSELLTSMDESNGDSGYVLVIGATNLIDAIDPALRRAGRFDREILLPIPDESAREEILFALACTKKLRLDASVDLRKIARSTPGYVGADLVALANQAGTEAIDRMARDRMKQELSQGLTSEPAEDRLKEHWSEQEISKLAIKMSDFEEAAKKVQPSLTRKGFSSIPRDVEWENVGGLVRLKQAFDFYIIGRIQRPKDYEVLSMEPETGFLLYGPPGCGKTLIAKAVARKAGANFIYIKGPEILNKYVGESELEVRNIFSRARACAPCILFFDEVDALTTKHGNDSGRVIQGVLKQLLVELDGAEQRKGVFVIGATNRPDVMDQAVLRPGRFGELLYVPLPSPDDRVLILKTLAKKLERKCSIDPNVDFNTIGRMKACENLSGADLRSLMFRAETAALQEWQRLGSIEETRDRFMVKTSHFEVALSEISPSVSAKQRRFYQRMYERLEAA